MQSVLARGDYAIVEESLASFQTRLKEMEETLKKVAALRARITNLQEQTGQVLSGLHQWMRQYPADFTLDTAQEWVHVSRHACKNRPAPPARKTRRSSKEPRGSFRRDPPLAGRFRAGSGGRQPAGRPARPRCAGGHSQARRAPGGPPQAAPPDLPGKGPPGADGRTPGPPGRKLEIDR